MLGIVRLAGFASAIVVTIAGAVSSLFFPLSSRVVDVARGETLFSQRCASCHALDSAAAPKYGPSLDGIGIQAATRVPGMGVEEYLYNSIVRPNAYQAPGTTGEMPVNIAQGMSRDDLLGLTAFLCSQGGRFRASKLLRIASEEVEDTVGNRRDPPPALGSLERGRQLFLNELQCVHCHPLDAYPGSELLAPSLREIAHHDRAYLKEAILHPSRQIVPGYETWQVDQQGILRAGRRLPSPPDTVTLLEQDARGGVIVQSFKEGELEAIDGGVYTRILETSSMPEFEKTLTDEDMEALLDFLSTLK